MAKSVRDAYKKYHKALPDLKSSKDKLEGLIKIIEEKKTKSMKSLKQTGKVISNFTWSREKGSIPTTRLCESFQ